MTWIRGVVLRTYGVHPYLFGLGWWPGRTVPAGCQQVSCEQKRGSRHGIVSGLVRGSDSSELIGRVGGHLTGPPIRNG